MIPTIPVVLADDSLRLGPGAELCLLHESGGERFGTVASREAEPSGAHARAVALEVARNVFEVWYRAPASDVGRVRTKEEPC